MEDMQALANCVRHAVEEHQSSFQGNTSITINYLGGIIRVSCMNISPINGIDTSDYTCRFNSDDRCEFFSFGDLSAGDQEDMVLDLYRKAIPIQRIAEILAVPAISVRNILKKHRF